MRYRGVVKLNPYLSCNCDSDVNNFGIGSKSLVATRTPKTLIHDKKAADLEPLLPNANLPPAGDGSLGSLYLTLVLCGSKYRLPLRR